MTTEPAAPARVERLRPDVGALIRALRSHSFSFTNEAELQIGIETALRSEQIAFVREAALNAGDRIDFLVGVLGVEVKLKASPNAVIRQVHRYVQHSAIEAVLVITSSMKLATALPPEMNGKAVFAYCLAEDAL